MVILQNGYHLCHDENVRYDKGLTPHELFPSKGVPHQIPAELEFSRKFILDWRFEQIEERLLFFTICSENNNFEIELNCL